MELRLVRSTPKDPALGGKTGGEALGTFGEVGLLEGDAEGLGSNGRGRTLVFALLPAGGQTLLATLLLDPLLPVLMLPAAPGREDEVVLLDLGDEVLPLRDLNEVAVADGAGLLEHVGLDKVELVLDDLGEVGDGVVGLVTAGADDHAGLLGLNVARADLDTDRDALLLPVVVLPSGVVGVTIIELGTDALVQQRLKDILAVRGDVGHGHFLGHNGDDDSLQRGDARGQDQTGVVTVDHNHHTERTGGEAPTGLPGNLTLALDVLVSNVEHLAKVLAEVVGRGALDGTAGHGDVGLDGGGLMSTGELLLLRFVSRNDGDGKKVLVHLTVQIKGLHDHNVGIVVTDVGGVALLPQEFTRTEEGGGVLELPPDHVGPLIELEGQIAMALDPVRECGVHDGLGGGTDGDGLVQFAVTGLGHPGHLGSESLDVILLLFETILRHKEGKVRVLHVKLADLDVEPFLNEGKRGKVDWKKSTFELDFG